MVLVIDGLVFAPSIEEVVGAWVIEWGGLANLVAIVADADFGSGGVGVEDDDIWLVIGDEEIVRARFDGVLVNAVGGCDDFLYPVIFADGEGLESVHFARVTSDVGTGVGGEGDSFADAVDVGQGVSGVGRDIDAGGDTGFGDVGGSGNVVFGVDGIEVDGLGDWEGVAGVVEVWFYLVDVGGGILVATDVVDIVPFATVGGDIGGGNPTEESVIVDLHGGIRWGGLEGDGVGDGLVIVGGGSDWGGGIVEGIDECFGGRVRHECIVLVATSDSSKCVGFVMEDNIGDNEGSTTIA